MEIKLTKLDEKILYVLNMNSRLSFSKIARLVQSSREVVEYRIGRLEKLGVITRFSSVISSARQGVKSYHLLLKLEKASEKDESEFISFLQRDTNVRYIQKSRGYYDIFLIFGVKDRKELSEVIDRINEAYAGIIREREILIPIRPLKYREYPFFKKISYSQPRRKMKGPMELDDLDRNIVDTLKNNSRISFRELADSLDVPPETARYRFYRLKDHGIIKDFSITVDVERLGYSTYTVFLKLDTYSHRQDQELIEQFYKEPSLLSAQRVVGKFDIVVEILSQGTEEFEIQLSRLRDIFRNSIRRYEVRLKLGSYPLID